MRLIPIFIIPLAQCATFHRHDFESYRDRAFKLNISRTVLLTGSATKVVAKIDCW